MSSSAQRGSIPLPPEAFSPLATTNCTAPAATRRETTAATARRPGRPTTSPRKSSRTPPSAGDVACARLADHRHLDLAGIGHLLLDLARDIPGEQPRLLVGNRARIDDDAHLPACLDGEGLLDPAERVADPFEVLEALGVALEDLPTGSGAGPRERIGRIDQRGEDRLGLHLLVMRRDRVHDLRRLPVLARDLAPDDRMRALDLVGERLADIVEERRPPGLALVEPQLRRHGPRDEGGLDRVHEHVLGVAVAILEHADEPHQLGMDAVDADLEHRPLARLADGLVELLLGLADHLLDPRGVDAAVGNEPLEREAGQLAPDRVVAGDDDRLRCVVDDEVDPRRRLDGPDIAALPADDPALHVVARQRDHGDGALGDELPGQALDGDRHDLLRPPIGLLARLGLDLPDHLGGIVSRFLDHLIDERPLRLLAGEPGGLLELAPDAIDEPFVLGATVREPVFQLLEPLFASCQLGLPLCEALELAVDALLLLRLALSLAAGLDHEVLRLELRLLADDLGLLARFLDDSGRRLVGLGLELRQPAAAAPIDHAHDRRPARHPEDDPDERDHVDSSFPGATSSRASVATASTRSSQAASGTASTSCSSKASPIRTARGCRASARSYQPRPRPSRAPRASNATPGTRKTVPGASSSSGGPSGSAGTKPGVAPHRRGSRCACPHGEPTRGRPSDRPRLRGG